MESNLSIRIIVTTVLFFIVLPSTAMGYIDPGAGSVMLQVIMGSIFGVILFLKTFWSKIKTMFSKKDHDLS